MSECLIQHRFLHCSMLYTRYGKFINTTKMKPFIYTQMAKFRYFQSFCRSKARRSSIKLSINGGLNPGHYKSW
ncbi:hypothetical protein ACN38_g5719 [Penicillium nordicum]|uniref:Uncharacterized protein n=1 Tax=Penicillium nordicum TaxID=229535 RepID=A0A0M9WFY4_9EURO|nr:hypothetical protein ACN38_g5719 [Penicillium nordicum]